MSYAQNLARPLVDIAGFVREEQRLRVSLPRRERLSLNQLALVANRANCFIPSCVGIILAAALLTLARNLCGSVLRSLLLPRCFLRDEVESQCDFFKARRALENHPIDLKHSLRIIARGRYVRASDDVPRDVDSHRA